MKIPTDLTALSKDDLQRWHDADLAYYTLNQEVAFEHFDCLRTLSSDDCARFSDAIEKEDNRRDAVLEEQTLSEFETMPEVPEYDPTYRDHAFKRTLASLVRLTKLNAPDVIILQELQILNNRRPILAGQAEKLMKAIFAKVPEIDG